MARKQIVAGNWKMNKTRSEAVKLAEEVAAGVGDGLDREVILCPAYIALACVADKIKGGPVHLGGQNVHWEPSGAYTGEISTKMLAALGCRYVIVGHSERRALFGETDEEVANSLCRRDIGAAGGGRHRGRGDGATQGSPGGLDVQECG